MSHSNDILQITSPELKSWLDDANRSTPTVLDVREGWEFAVANIGHDALVHIPMGDIPRQFTELDEEKPVVCLCHHGVRSFQVAIFLKSQGFKEVYNLRGGIDAWSQLVDPNCPKY